MPHLHHPDLPLAHSAWSEDQTLHIAAAYSNPFRWTSRRRLANNFRRHIMGLPNTELHMIELAYGDRPFEITDPKLYPNDIQLRTTSELFHKENLLNIAISRFPANWKYGAIVDADFHFTRHDVALETIHQLQHYDWVQMFSCYQFLSGEHERGKGHRPIGKLMEGFAFTFHQNDRQIHNSFNAGWGKQVYSCGTGRGKARVGSSGGAWAFRRDAFDRAGGLLDRCILGSGDWFMAFGLAGQTIDLNKPLGKNVHLYTKDYLQYIQAWQRRAAEAFNGNIGYVDSYAVHHFHGPIVNRAYGSRDNILINHKYSPVRDVHPDWQGVLQLTDRKPELRADIRNYFLARNEDEAHRDSE